MKNRSTTKLLFAMLLFFAGTLLANGQMITRYGILDEFDNEEVSAVWDFTWNTKYVVTEEEDSLKISVTSTAEWDGFGLKPVNVGKSWVLSGATLEMSIRSEIAFTLTIQPNYDWNSRVDISVVPGNKVYTATFPSTPQTEDVPELSFNFRNNVSGQTGMVSIDYFAIGAGVEAMHEKQGGICDDFEDGILADFWDFTWNDPPKYVPTEDDGILSISVEKTDDWQGFGLKPITLGHTVNLAEKTFECRVKSDVAFTLFVQPEYNYNDRIQIAVPASASFITIEGTFKSAAAAECDIEHVKELSFNFNNLSGTGTVEFEYIALGDCVDEVSEKSRVFYDDFSDDVLVNDEPWSDYDEGNYTLTESDGILTVADNKASTWSGFGLKFLEAPMDFSKNAVVSFSARTTDVAEMVIKFGDVDGNWDQWGTQGHPKITMQQTDYFTTYSIDIAATMEAGVDVYDLSRISEISIYFDVNQTNQNDTVEFEWFSIGNPPSPDRLQSVSGQNYFANGMNIAWLEYGGVELLNWSADEARYIEALDEMADYGVNSIRWWLHTHTVNTPEFDASGMCTGIQSEALDAIKKALDLAQERGIVVDLVLFTHNLFKTNAGENNYQRNLDLVTDPVFTQAYIDNALIPMVEHVKGHPAIMAWEVMNEPEYATFPSGVALDDPTKAELMQFFNLIAGAIHRTDRSAKVTVGMGQFQNIATWCKDADLIASGGDKDGILDFYQGHYYGSGTNPFATTPAAMGIDEKPVIIGEYSPFNEGGNPVAGVPEDPYITAYNNGYAGIMAWKYFETPGDNTGSFDDHKPDIEEFVLTNPEDIAIDFGEVNSMPYAKKQIPLFLAWPKAQDWDTVLVQLDTIFFDKEDGTDLTFSIGGSSNEMVATAEIVETNKLQVNVKANAGGEAIIVVLATDTEGKEGSTEVRVYGVDPANLALGKTAKVSSKESDSKLASNALDGNPTTRWASDLGGANGDATDDEWFIIDLGADYYIGTVGILWENAYGKQYKIVYAPESEKASTWDIITDEALESFADESWHVAQEVTDGDGEMDEYTFTGEDQFVARYIGFRGVERFNSEWGFSIYEFSVKEGDIPDYTITIHVVDQDGNNIEQANVSFNGENKVTGSDGLATFENVEISDTPYQYSVTHDDYEDASGEILADQDKTVDVEMTLLINVEESGAGQFKVYPNPCAEYVMIECPEEANIDIYDHTGRLKQQLHDGGSVQKVAFDSYSEGLYYLIITTENQTVCKKLIHQ
jgi:hypothetical protein